MTASEREREIVALDMVREALERVLDCAGTFEERLTPEQLAADRATLELALALRSEPQPSPAKEEGPR